jgi:SAM-dependent methyltransferase
MFSNDKIWESAESYMTHLQCNTNYYTTFNILEPIIKEILPVKILDLGSGYGWTSILLSQWSKNSIIYSTDIDKDLIIADLSFIYKKLNCSEENRIHRIVADYSTVGESYLEEFDLVIVTAAIHHSLNLLNDLISIRKTIKPGGILILANEFDISNYQLLPIYFRKILSIIWNTTFSSYSINDQLIGQGRVRYDSYLGDWFVSNSYYEYIANAAGFKNFRSINTKIMPYKKNIKGNIFFVKHFIFQV